MIFNSFGARDGGATELFEARDESAGPATMTRLDALDIASIGGATTDDGRAGPAEQRSQSRSTTGPRSSSRASAGVRAEALIDVT